MKDWIKAGEIASEVLEYGKGLIKKDKSVLAIIEIGCWSSYQWSHRRQCSYCRE